MPTKAFRRVHQTRGASFLTHGADDHDHKGLNKARRALDRALVVEGQEADEPHTPVEDSTGPYRIVITTQVYENYGTHCCDCESDETCTCDAYWKAKGGSEYQAMVGSAADVIELGANGLEELAQKLGDKVSQCTRFYHEYLINWGLYGSNEETYDERMYREMLEEGYLTREQYEHQVKRLRIL